VGWLNAFVMAVQSANNTHNGLNYLAIQIANAYAPPPSQPAPVPAPTPAPAAPPPSMQVTGFKGQFPAHEQKELGELLLSAFPRRSDLENIVTVWLDSELGHIVVDGLLPEVVEGLVRWCVKKNKVVPLLNAILSERPQRTDVKPLMRKFAQAGTITIVGE